MENEPSKDSIKISGTKRATPDSLVYSKSPSGNLVYVRRKYETEPDKNKISEKTADDPKSEESEHKEVLTEQKITEKEPMPIEQKTPLSESPSTPLSLAKPSNCTSPEVISVNPISSNSEGVNDLHWRVRFAQLHAYLESCENSNQEAYNNMLRSSTPAERSRYAVELEKRVIQLAMEEGREMHRVKVLNILGKSNPNNNL